VVKEVDRERTEVDAFVKLSAVEQILSDKDTKLQAAFRAAAKDPVEEKPAEEAASTSAILGMFAKMAKK